MPSKGLNSCRYGRSQIHELLYSPDPSQCSLPHLPLDSPASAQEMEANNRRVHMCLGCSQSVREPQLRQLPKFTIVVPFESSFSSGVRKASDIPTGTTSNTYEPIRSKVRHSLGLPSLLIHSSHGPKCVGTVSFASLETHDCVWSALFPIAFLSMIRHAAGPPQLFCGVRHSCLHNASGGHVCEWPIEHKSFGLLLAPWCYQYLFRKTHGVCWLRCSTSSVAFKETMRRPGKCFLEPQARCVVQAHG